jgi:hypothetical protein
MLKVTCPNCARYTLSLWHRMSLLYRLPTQCPKCRKWFINAVGAEILWALALCAGGVLLGMTVDGLEEPELYAIGLLVFPARALFVKPLPYRFGKSIARR